tara:strand:- start:498 stop:1289 length:792 start_codon:yes stop_codon:yes gene_type:complete
MKVRPNKKLGQNFLIDQNIINFISKACKISNTDNVFEIGPGSGNITNVIYKQNPKKLILIEKDNNLASHLKNLYQKDVKIINNDFMLLNDELFNLSNIIVYGNLPYNVSTQILIKLLRLNSINVKFKKLYLMFQKEVADRILAKKNTKKYGRLSVISQWRMSVKKLIDVKPRSFFPVPKVDSTLLEFTPKKNFYSINNIRNLEYVTRILFNHKRKMLKRPFNILFGNFPEVSKLLKIDTKLRPGNIDAKNIYKICQEYEKLLD